MSLVAENSVTELAESAPRAVAQLSTPAQLLQLAMQQNADLDRLERLMQLQQQWEANEARKAYFAALAAFRAETVVVEKAKLVEFTTRDGDTTRYKHAELADYVNNASPMLSKHGLSHSWQLQQENGGVTVTCRLSHRDGHYETVSLSAAPDSSGKKNSIQQIASSITYLERYTFAAITGIAAQGMDDDGLGADAKDKEKPLLMSADHVATITALIDETKTDKSKLIELVCKHLKIDKVEHLKDLPDSCYGRVVSTLNTRK